MYTIIENIISLNNISWLTLKFYDINNTYEQAG